MSAKLPFEKASAFMIKKGRFTTQDVSRKFRTGYMSAAAAIAIGKLKGVVANDTPAKDGEGHSRWKWVGSKTL